MCLVQDVSAGGLLLVCNQQFKVGQILDLAYELSPGKPLECKIEIRHYDDNGMGAKIVEVSPTSEAAYRSYVQAFYSDMLSKFD